MKWYFPSWNGDLRLEADCDDADKTVLMIVRPTLDEVRIVNLIGAECLKEGWLKEWQEFEPPLFTYQNVMRFKNPFGDGGDGVADSMFTQSFGLVSSMLLGVELDRGGGVSRSFESLAMNIGATLAYRPPRQVDPQTGTLVD